jgi:transposase
MKIKTYSKSELSAMYGVHVNTFSKWIKTIPELIVSPHQRKLTPKQVMLIVNHLGEP